MHLDRHQQRAIGLTVLPAILLWQVNGIYLAALARIDPYLFWAADLAQWVLLPAVLLTVLAKRSGVRPAHYGCGLPSPPLASLVLGSLGVFVTAGLVFYWTRYGAWQLLGRPSGFFTFPGVFPGGPMGTVIWLYSAATAGIVESIFFIGLPWRWYQGIRETPSRAAYALLVSLVFAAAHWEQGPHIVIAAFFFNLVACAWYFKLGSLWPIVVGHALIDLVVFS